MSSSGRNRTTPPETPRGSSSASAGNEPNDGAASGSKGTPPTQGPAANVNQAVAPVPHNAEEGSIDTTTLNHCDDDEGTDCDMGSSRGRTPPARPDTPVVTNATHGTTRGSGHAFSQLTAMIEVDEEEDEKAEKNHHDPKSTSSDGDDGDDASQNNEGNSKPHDGQAGTGKPGGANNPKGPGGEGCEAERSERNQPK